MSNLFQNAGSLADYVNPIAAILVLAFHVLIFFSIIVTNILVWTIPSKNKKKALKNLNGDKKLYSKILTSSGAFVAFCVLNSIAITASITSFISFFTLWPYTFNSSYYSGFSSEYNTITFLFCALFAEIQLIIIFIVAVSLKLKADRSALSKSSHTQIVRKFRNSMNKKK